LKPVTEMQGPEQQLVGDVAERIPQPAAAEEMRSRESADVGEIGGAVELRASVERLLTEARRVAAWAAKDDDKFLGCYIHEVEGGLAKLLAYVVVTDGQRSDLSNAEPIRSGGGVTPSADRTPESP